MSATIRTILSRQIGGKVIFPAKKFKMNSSKNPYMNPVQKKRLLLSAAQLYGRKKKSTTVVVQKCSIACSIVLYMHHGFQNPDSNQMHHKGD